MFFEAMQLPNKAEFELIPQSGLFSFAVREFSMPRFESPWHFHPECELTLITAGSGRRFIGDNIAAFSPGDLVLIGPNLPHHWRNDPPEKSPARHSRSLVIQFREEFCGPDFLALPETAPVRDLLLRARRGLHFTGKTRDAVAEMMAPMPGCKGFDRLLALLGIFRLLVESDEFRILSSPGFSPPLDEFASERINRAYKFIFGNFASPIRHEDIARDAGMSLSAFGHYFKRITGHTLTDFINEIRVGHAARLLISTDHPVSMIAFGSGFESLSHFNHRFLRLNGVSPKEYRKVHRASAPSK